MFRTPETGRIGRDTPCLYAWYSVVFRCRMHTNSARKPYCRKGFQICIQCIQRIPTPFVFRFSLLLGREYMNTVNTPACPRGVSFRHGSPPSGVFGRCGAGDLVFSSVPEYSPPAVPTRRRAPKNTPNRPRHALNVCIVFRCIQMPNAYKFRLKALLP